MLIHRLVKQMNWKPHWGKPYDTFLWSVTLQWAEGCNLKVKRENVWDLAAYIANKVDTK